MERITYVSTARGVCDASLAADILATSRRNNGRNQLTGLLVVGGRRFLQVIEGPSAALEATYRRIIADPRHFALVEIERRPIDVRSFPQWAMGCDQAAAISGTSLSATIERMTSDVGDLGLQAHLRGFAALHDKAA